MTESKRRPGRPDVGPRIPVRLTDDQVKHIDRIAGTGYGRRAAYVREAVAQRLVRDMSDNSG